MDNPKLKRIVTVMSVCGHHKYFSYAKRSIRSFVEGNPEHHLYVFTDAIERLDYFSYKNLHLVDFQGALDKVPLAVIQHINGHTLPTMRELKYQDRIHVHSYVSLLLPMAQIHLHDHDSDYILKIDCDSFFVGNYMNTVEHAVLKEDYPLYLVERKHDLMVIRNGTGFEVGVGFTLWKKKGSFINRYVSHFNIDEQRTISTTLYMGRNIPCKILTSPGFHFVYPFKRTRDFSKKHADRFVPAYFHLTGEHIVDNLKKLVDWYGYGCSSNKQL